MTKPLDGSKTLSKTDVLLCFTVGNDIDFYTQESLLYQCHYALYADTPLNFTTHCFDVSLFLTETFTTIS